jgi:hypothetical protein
MFTFAHKDTSHKKTYEQVFADLVKRLSRKANNTLGDVSDL